jgi:hypothetical protein
MSDTDCGFDEDGPVHTAGADAGQVIRVERGLVATSEELAAVTAVLLSRLAAGRGQPARPPAPHVPRWRPGLPPAAYRSPHSWR